MIFHFAAASLALAVERVVGYPKPIYKKIGHPVEWIGKLISWFEKNLNTQSPSSVPQAWKKVPDRADEGSWLSFRRHHLWHTVKIFREMSNGALHWHGRQTAHGA